MLCAGLNVLTLKVLGEDGKGYLNAKQKTTVEPKIFDIGFGFYRPFERIAAIANAAISILKIRGPSEICRQAFCLSCNVSSSVKPPSGPMATASVGCSILISVRLSHSPYG